MTQYDYTFKRLGSKQPPYGKKVIICGDCGRRGTNDGLYQVKDGRRFQIVTHVSHIVCAAGIRFNHTDEGCHYQIPAPAAEPAATVEVA